VTNDNPQRTLRSLRDNIESSDAISEKDREMLLRFDDRLSLMRSEVGTYRHSKLLRHVFIIARESDDSVSVADAVEDREAAESCVRWVHRNRPKSDSEETNRDYRVALRQLGKRVTEGDDVPDTLAWISSSTSSNYNPKPDPSKMVSYDEMKRLVDAAQNPRDAALVSVMWDAGARSGEFRNLKLGDVSDHDHGLQLRVDGKTGERTITLIPSVPHLRMWLNHHPGDDPDDPLWCALDEAEPLAYRSMKDALERLSGRADRFNKPMTPTNFRKSRASDLASKGMSQAHLEDRMGWVRGSEAASRYISVFAEDAEREFARLEGVEVDEEDEPETHAPYTCPRCDKETPRDEGVCVWCGQALDPVAAEALDSAEDALFDHVIEADDEDLVEDLRALKDRLDDPAVRALLARAGD